VFIVLEEVVVEGRALDQRQREREKKEQNPG
jgi:hypothetical protein